MSEDPLETELRLLRPVTLSPQAQNRIAQRLRDAQHTKSTQGRRRMIFAAATMAAACLVLAALVDRSGHRAARPALVAAPRTSSPTPPFDPDVQQFTLAAYRRASAVSVDALYAMLDRQAVARAGPVAKERPADVTVGRTSEDALAPSR